jgi:hypothetical protein
MRSPQDPSKFFPILADLACAAAGCNIHSHPYETDGNEVLLDIWSIVAQGSTAFPPRMTSLSLSCLLRVCQHLKAPVLAAAIQGEGRKDILSKIWATLAAADRRLRMLSG